MAEDEKPWMIRDVPEHTRRKVKVFAADRGLTMGQAIESLVDIAFASLVESEGVAVLSSQTDSGIEPILATAEKLATAEVRLKRKANTSVVSMEEVATILGISRAAAYNLIRTGLIPSIKIGQTRRVAVSSLHDYIQRLTEGKPDEAGQELQKK
jgi:excisionase family DNA binding protein